MTRELLFGFIAAEKTTYPVRLLCRVLQVSASAFYDWVRRGSAAISDARPAAMRPPRRRAHRRVRAARGST
jgi:hypothetical protein